MIRGLEGDACEMKRLFVRPAFRGLGLARAMTRKLARLADSRGYAHMRLESGVPQTEALALYRSLGFRPVDPYHACPQWLVDNSRFLETHLDALLARTPLKMSGDMRASTAA
jgi:ribosomal protein S18 acetylase RimI-like enzyme